MAFIDSAIELWDKSLENISAGAQKYTKEWDQNIQRLKDKATEFQTLYNKLAQKREIAAKNPELQKAYDKLMKSGDVIRTSLEKVTQAIDFGAGFLFGGRPPDTDQMNGVWLVPVIVLTTGVTAMTAWITSAYKLDRELDTADRMIEQGMDPTGYLKSQSTTSNLLGLGKIVLYTALVGGAVYLIGPKIRDMIDG